MLGNQGVDAQESANQPVSAMMIATSGTLQVVGGRVVDRRAKSPAETHPAFAPKTEV